jgi:(1->4)-alpha-D-glucan 1-alpha-D-glucosylmutase
VESQPHVADSIPTATYRLQLRREFSLRSVSALLPYLHQLGISDLYLSPLYAARPGSLHGYDVIDHNRLNPELGDGKALRALFDEAATLGLGIILDVVPNHMCIAGDQNLLWLDVLEDGRGSPTAAYFDIDWDPPKAELVGKVLLPFLSEQYGRVLEGELLLDFGDGRFFVTWNGQRLPLNPVTLRHVLEPALEHLHAQEARDDTCELELESILRALSQTLPTLRDAGDGGRTEYLHEKEAIRRRLAAWFEGSTRARGAVTHALGLVNGTPGVPSTFDRLERLMADQFYRLANWRVAAHEINYRRFFDVNELAAIRVEHPKVFVAVHALPFSLATHAAFRGFRIDHVDGLADPEGYLNDLLGGWHQSQVRSEGEDRATSEGDGHVQRPSFVVVEKILGPQEALPSGWRVQGTTGYDFIQILADLFTRSAGAAQLQSAAATFCGPQASFPDVAYESKRLVLQTTLAAELTVLARHLDRISEQHRYTRDFTLNHLQSALAEIVACFPVYRTYIRRNEPAVVERDAKVIRKAVAEARRRTPLINASLFDFVASVLLGQNPPGLDEAQLEERRDLVMRFQQLTGPVVAKGVEDTAFYRQMTLIALNEVGGYPVRMGAPSEDIHRALRIRAETTPHTLSATATHDTKRGEDARARLYVLSERTQEWLTATASWSAMNARQKEKVDDLDAPAATEEYLLYQTLVGAWPIEGWNSDPTFPERIRTYMTKARSEAKTHTSWINPNVAYADAADRFVQAVLDPARARDFLQSVDAFVGTILRPGLWNSLAQVVLKVASPGIPDFFQGAELWDFSLVDPDNRRLVDFEQRRALLEAVASEFDNRGLAAVDAWFQSPADGRIKMWLSTAALRLRRSHADLFKRGAYQPLRVRGEKAAHAFAFARVDGDACVIAAVGRFLATLGAEPPVAAAWGNTALELPRGRGRWRDALTGCVLGPDDARLSLGSVFAHLPVALLERVP